MDFLPLLEKQNLLIIPYTHHYTINSLLLKMINTNLSKQFVNTSIYLRKKSIHSVKHSDFR